MFQGASELSLDAKGRIAVPTKHRDALVSGTGKVVLTGHPDRCLLLFPSEAFQPISERISKMPTMEAHARWWRRMVIGYAEELELDGSGRILISPALRKLADIQKQVMLVGQGTHFELWGLERWEAQLGAAMDEVASTPPSGTEDFVL